MSSSSLNHGEAVSHNPTVTPQTIANLLQFHLAREKLISASRISALLAGFSLVAIIELDTSEQGLNAPQPLLAVYTTIACLVLVTLTLAVMISSCIEPHIDCYEGLFSYRPMDEPPHVRFRLIIEVAWVFGTLVGMSLFLTVILLACWVKFWYISVISVIVSAVIVVPALVLFVVFAIVVNRILKKHANQHSERIIRYLETRMDLLESGELVHNNIKQDDDFDEF